MVSWSSGKDAAWALHRLREITEVEVVGLLTTLNEAAGRVAMHAVRERLLEAQAGAADLPLRKVWLPHPCTDAEYRARMAAALREIEAEGVEAFAFGDLFLEDVRRYREQQLRGTPFDALFPLWGEDSATLAREMIAGGLRAILTCVDPKQLDPSFCGRAYDAALLDDLPDDADPCGENGEFHTLVHAGPMLATPIAVTAGETVERDGFVFCDVIEAP